MRVAKAKARQWTGRLGRRRGPWGIRLPVEATERAALLDLILSVFANNWDCSLWPVACQQGDRRGEEGGSPLVALGWPSRRDYTTNDLNSRQQIPMYCVTLVLGAGNMVPGATARCPLPAAQARTVCQCTVLYNSFQFTSHKGGPVPVCRSLRGRYLGRQMSASWYLPLPGQMLSGIHPHLYPASSQLGLF